MSELLQNDASTVVSSGGTSAVSPGTVETWQVASPGAFGWISALSLGNQARLVDLTNEGHIYGGEIMLVTDSYCTTLSSALTEGDTYTTISVEAIPSALPFGTPLNIYDPSLSPFGQTYLWQTPGASVGATTLDLPDGNPPTVISASAGSSTGTTVEVSAPADLVQNTVLLAVLTSPNSTSWTPPDDDWVLLASLGSAPYTGAYYKYTTASEPSSYSFTGTANDNSCAILQVKAVAYDPDQYTFSAVSGTTVTWLDVTTSYNNELVLLIAASGTGKTFTTPSGCTAVTNSESAGNVGITVFSTTQSTAGSIGTHTSTASGSDSVTAIVLTWQCEPIFQATADYTTSTRVAAVGQSGANPFWIVTRGAEPLIPGATASTIAHTAGFTATNTLSAGALLNYMTNQPQTDFSVGNLNGAYATFDGLTVEGGADITGGAAVDLLALLTGSDNSYGITIQTQGPSYGAFDYDDPASPTPSTTLFIVGPGSVNGVSFQNDSVGIGAVASGATGTVASAPPNSSFFNSASVYSPPSIASADMAIIGLMAGTDVTATASSPWTDWAADAANENATFNWTDGLDVVWQTLSGSGPWTADWTIDGDTPWSTLGLILVHSSGTGLAMVQEYDAGGQDDGTHTMTVFSSDTTVGHAVALLILDYQGNNVNSLTSSMGTFTRVCGFYNSAVYGGYGMEWWVCTDVIAAGTTVTFDTNSVFNVAAFEISGGVASAFSGGSVTNVTYDSDSPSLELSNPGYFVQISPLSGASVGDELTAFEVPVSVGNGVAVLVQTADDTTVTGISSPIGTFTYAGGTSEDDIGSGWWVCGSATERSTEITIEASSGTEVAVAAFEVYGPVEISNLFTSAAGTGTSPSVSMTSVDDKLLLVGVLAIGTITAGPSSPFTSFNGTSAPWEYSAGIDFAYGYSTSSSQSPTWTVESSDFPYVVSGLSLTLGLPTVSLGTAWQNPYSYDVWVKATLITGTVSGTPVISAGVGASSTPTVNTVIPSGIDSDTVYVLGDFKVPAGYYLLIKDTGSGDSLGSYTFQTWAQAA